MTSDEHRDDSVAGSRLRVLTWNLWGRYGPWQRRLPAIATTLATLDADVIALQEVWSDDTTNLAAELAAGLGYHHAFIRAMDNNGFGEGNAVLSRWPIASSTTTKLSGEPESGESRHALHAEISSPRGPLAVYCTHLNFRGEHGHIRQAQVADLARFVDRRQARNFPPIVCGDLNAEPDSDEVRMLTELANCPVDGLVFNDAWRLAGGDGPGHSWASANPHVASSPDHNRRIDYILVGQPEANGAGQIVDCRVTGDEPVDGMQPSDHYAVLAELRF